MVKGTLTDPLAFKGAAVGLLVAGPDLALLAPLTGVPFPATRPYELGGRLDYEDGHYRFTDMAGTLGRSDIAGALAIAPGSERPMVTAELRSAAVHLTDLGGFIGAEPDARQQGAARARRRLLPDAPFNVPKLTGADVRLDYRAERIQGESMPLDDLAARLEITDGVATLKPLSFGVGHGRILGDITVSPRDGDSVQAQAQVQFQRMDLARLIGATAGVEGGGTLNGAARIEGVGQSFADLVGRGEGGLTLVMAGGNLSALLVDLSGLQFGDALLSALGLPRRTKVECFVADFVLRRGSLASRALLLETEDSITEGRGGLDLGRERIELRLRTESKRLTIGSLPTPLLITGTLSDPRIVPEPSELAVRGGIAGALAAIAPPLAVLPTLQFGTGDDPRCEALVRRARQGPREQRGR
jgi:uncharacterized protein involved in outer membrane biogenesis